MCLPDAYIRKLMVGSPWHWNSNFITWSNFQIQHGFRESQFGWKHRLLWWHGAIQLMPNGKPTTKDGSTSAYYFWCCKSWVSVNSDPLGWGYVSVQTLKVVFFKRSVAPFLYFHCMTIFKFMCYLCVYVCFGYTTRKATRIGMGA